MAQNKFIMAGFSPIQIPGGLTLTNSLINPSARERDVTPKTIFFIQAILGGGLKLGPQTLNHFAKPCLSQILLKEEKGYTNRNYSRRRIFNQHG